MNLDRRSAEQVHDELDEEFAFHLEALANKFIEAGEDPAVAADRARRRFGDIDKIKRQCSSIQLKERIMLQRINLGLILVLIATVVSACALLFSAQRQHTEALDRISSQLASRQQAPASRGVCYIDGSVLLRPGVYNLPQGATLTVGRLIAAAGGLTDMPVRVQLRSSPNDVHHFFDAVIEGATELMNLDITLRAGDHVHVAAIGDDAARNEG